MLGIPYFLLSDSQRKMMADRARCKAEEMMENAVPWDPAMKWQKELALIAKSYNDWLKQWFLFPDLQAQPRKNKTPIDGPHVLSPGGDIVYVHCRSPGKVRVQTYYGKQVGSVWFTGPVTMPVLLRKNYADRFEFRDEFVWMSLTPMEVFTLRGGIRRAKGNVIVAGLGLGYQLMQVCRRKKVDSVTLVEINQDLVDWLLPVIQKKLGPDADKILKVEVGDAKDIVPKMKADVALIDIDSGYGGNYFNHSCPGIGYVWVWGSQYAT